jgi:hypothetical protein
MKLKLYIVSSRDNFGDWVIRRPFFDPEQKKRLAAKEVVTEWEVEMPPVFAVCHEEGQPVGVCFDEKQAEDYAKMGDGAYVEPLTYITQEGLAHKQLEKVVGTLTKDQLNILKIAFQQGKL